MIIRSAPGTSSTAGAVAERSVVSGSAVGEVTVAVFLAVPLSHSHDAHLEHQVAVAQAPSGSRCR